MAMSRRRRSTMSARAPAGNASSIIGMLSAASTSATIDGEDESEVINQPDPTSCIHVPMLDTMVAIQRLRKRAFRRGLQAEESDLIPAASTEPGEVMARQRSTWSAKGVSLETLQGSSADVRL